MSYRNLFGGLLSLAAVVALGCGSSEPAKPAPNANMKPSPSTPDKNAGEKAHAPHGEGPHGGTVIDWGGGKYHVEFTVDHDKKETIVYILGGDEKTPAPIKADTITVTIDDPASEIEAKAQPLEGEKDGMSSRFVGTHDTLGIVKEYSGTISGEIEGTPYSKEFKEEPHKD
jgi:hypothetical protein